MALTWVNVQDLVGVSIAAEGSYSTDGDVFIATGAANILTVEPPGSDDICTPAGDPMYYPPYVSITVPATGYVFTGRHRLTIIENELTGGGPNARVVHALASYYDFEPPPGEYVFDETYAPCLVPGGTIYTRAGTVGGGSFGGGAVWRLEVEVEETPPEPPGAFWTDIIKAKEQ